MSGNVKEDNDSSYRMFYKRRGEIIAKENLIKLKSKSDRGLPKFLLPPVEGLATPFVSLAAEMDCPVYGIQTTTEILKFDSIKEIAINYVELVRSIQSTGPYHFVGYSYGTLLGLEMAWQLENSGESVKLTCIEGSPEYGKILVTKYFSLGEELKNCESDRMQRMMSCYGIQLNYNLSFNEIYWSLDEFAGDEGKMMDKLVDLVDRPEYSAKDIKDTFYLLLKIFTVGLNFEPSGKLSNPFTLIRVAQDVLPLPEDYKLSQYCNDKINVHKLNATHGSILSESNVKDILKLL